MSDTSKIQEVIIIEEAKTYNSLENLSLGIFPCQKERKKFAQKTVKVKTKYQVKYVVFKEEWMVQENQRRQVVKKTMWKHSKSYGAHLLIRTEKFLKDWNVQLCQELDAKI